MNPNVQNEIFPFLKGRYFKILYMCEIGHKDQTGTTLTFSVYHSEKISPLNLSTSANLNLYSKSILEYDSGDQMGSFDIKKNPQIRNLMEVYFK
jgi:hypothetical protein